MAGEQKLGGTKRQTTSICLARQISNQTIFFFGFWIWTSNFVYIQPATVKEGVTTDYDARWKG